MGHGLSSPHAFEEYPVNCPTSIAGSSDVFAVFIFLCRPNFPTVFNIDYPFSSHIYLIVDLNTIYQCLWGDASDAV